MNAGVTATRIPPSETSPTNEQEGDVINGPQTFNRDEPDQ